MPRNDDKGQWIKQIGLLTAIPVLLVIGPAIGYVVGHWLDGKLESEPIFTIVFIVLGFVASGKEVYQLIRRASRDLD